MFRAVSFPTVKHVERGPKSLRNCLLGDIPVDPLRELDGQVHSRLTAGRDAVRDRSDLRVIGLNEAARRKICFTLATGDGLVVHDLTADQKVQRRPASGDTPDGFSKVTADTDEEDHDRTDARARRRVHGG